MVSGLTITGNLGQNRTALAADRVSRARSLLVVAQITLASVVLTAAGLMLRTYRDISWMDLGFMPDHVLTMRVVLPALNPGNSAILNFSRELIGNLRALSGVIDVAMSSKGPMEDSVSFLDFSIPTRPLNSTTGLTTAAYWVVTPSYFTLIRNPLHEGRLFTQQDGPDAPSVIIVNESFARTFILGESALDKQVRLLFSSNTQAEKEARIVGIVSDSRQFSRDLHDVLLRASATGSFPAIAAESRGCARLGRSREDPRRQGDFTQNRILRGRVGLRKAKYFRERGS